MFLKFFGNENEFTKHLFETRLRTPLTPTFTFWRQGGLLPSRVLCQSQTALYIFVKPIINSPL